MWEPYGDLTVANPLVLYITPVLRVVVPRLKKQLAKERREFSEREDELIAHCQKLESALDSVVSGLELTS